MNQFKCMRSSVAASVARPSSLDSSRTTFSALPSVFLFLSLSLSFSLFLQNFFFFSLFLSLLLPIPSLSPPLLSLSFSLFIFFLLSSSASAVFAFFFLPSPSLLLFFSFAHSPLRFSLFYTLYIYRFSLPPLLHRLPLVFPAPFVILSFFYSALSLSFLLSLSHRFCTRSSFSAFRSLKSPHSRHAVYSFFSIIRFFKHPKYNSFALVYKGSNDCSIRIVSVQVGDGKRIKKPNFNFFFHPVFVRTIEHSFRTNHFLLISLTVRLFSRYTGANTET